MKEDVGILIESLRLGQYENPDEKIGLLATDTIVRQYELGLKPRIRDARSGRSTSKVGRIIKGYLDTFFMEP